MFFSLKLAMATDQETYLTDQEGMCHDCMT